MKRWIYFSAGFFLIFVLTGAMVVRVAAHPLGGVLQKTVISDLTTTILIEYDTHIGPQVVLTLHPDKDFNGVLDDREKAEFLDRVNRLLIGNITCRLGAKQLTLQEMGRKLTLEDPGDFKNGLNTQFVWRVDLTTNGKPAEGLFKIKDTNFRAGEMNQLNYFVTVLGDTGPMRLADDGRELIWDISAGKPISRGPQTASSISSIPVGGSSTRAMKEKEETGREVGYLKSLFRTSPGTFGLYLFGLVTAFVLGAFHALSPGHGKSMVAAYLMGSQGRIADAIRLGLIVTVTHVFSVVVLGLLALIISRYTLSRDFFPWLGVASGALIFFTGYFLLARMALAAAHHHHHHHIEHDHAEHLDQKTSGHSLKEIISLGVAGGLVPCPSAIVILLFAIAVNRIVTGLLIILTFSLGLAAVLILIGVLTVTASRRLKQMGPGVGWVRRLPVFSAGIIMVLGVVIGVNALVQAGILTLNL